MMIVLNHKSNLTKEEFISYYDKLTKLDISNEEVILCPSFPHFALVTPSNIILGAQNVSKNCSGAHTGEVSATQLKSYNVEYAIVGHSERRTAEKETGEEVSAKVKNLLSEDITPIICIGETKEEKENPEVLDSLYSELLESTKNFNQEDYEKIVIAYEPIWSIGTGVLPSNEEIKEKVKFLKDKFPKSRIIYGGSVNDANIEELKKNDSLDGFLIGGMSLDINKLDALLKIIKKDS
ncbi:MAG: triosephosphate isomerase [Bacilli bacterium]|nr:triosephosphate isomerase [Bacilli bacterium]